MALTVSQLEYLCSQAGSDAMGLDLPEEPLLAQKRLRKQFSVEQANAISFMRTFRKHVATCGKFPTEWAPQMMGSDDLLQQASSIRLGRYIARRLARTGGSVHELCCGMGGDAISLAAEGMKVACVDISGESLICARQNVRAADFADKCTFCQADIAELDLPADSVVHIDPDRRFGGRRSVAMEDYSPPADVLRKLVETTRAGAMKLSPALGRDELADWPGVTLEHISEGGTCKQLVVWWGVNAENDAAAGEAGGNRATIVSGELDAPQSISISAGVAPLAEIRAIENAGEYLIEPGPEVLAAGAVDDLAQREGLWRIGANLVWLFADAPADTPFGRSFHILDRVPGRVKDIRRAVNRLGGGVVEVKPRGVPMDTDKMQRALSRKGDRPLAVLWTRLGDKQTAFIAERV